LKKMIANEDDIDETEDAGTPARTDSTNSGDEYGDDASSRIGIDRISPSEAFSAGSSGLPSHQEYPVLVYDPRFGYGSPNQIYYAAIDHGSNTEQVSVPMDQEQAGHSVACQNIAPGLEQHTEPQNTSPSFFIAPNLASASVGPPPGPPNQPMVSPVVVPSSGYPIQQYHLTPEQLQTYMAQYQRGFLNGEQSI
jgi:hypothetical protein